MFLYEPFDSIDRRASALGCCLALLRDSRPYILVWSGLSADSPNRPVSSLKGRVSLPRSYVRGSVLSRRLSKTEPLIWRDARKSTGQRLRPWLYNRRRWDVDGRGGCR